MKTKIAVILLVTLFLSACSTQPAPVAQVEQPSSTPQATSTITNTPAPTDTPVPTNTPQPTATLTPTATPVPETISLSNVGSLELVRRYGEGRMVQTLWSPDASQLLVLTTVHLKAYDPADGKLLWQVETGSPQTQMVNSEDSRSITTISTDGAVKVWDAASGQAVKTVFEPRDGIDISSISSSGDFVAFTSSSKETTIWDVNSGEQVASNDGSSVPLGMIGTLLSSENSVFWTNGFGSGETQQIQGWDGASGQFLRGLKGTSQLYVTELLVSPDSTMIAGVSRLALTSQPQFSFLIWEAETGNILTRVDFTEDIQAYAFIAGQDKALIASGSGYILPVRLSTGEVGEKFGFYKSTVISLSASPDGKRLGVAYADGVIHFYDLTSMKLQKQIDMELSMTIAPYDLNGENYIQRIRLYNGIGSDKAGKFVAALSPDRLRLNLIDPYTLKLIRSTPLTDMAFTSLDVSQDGKMVAGVDESNRIIIYYATTGTKKIAIKAEQVYRITMILFSPDGSQIASLSGGYLAELYVYDTETGKKVHTLSGYNTMTYSPNGTTLVSDNIDYGIYVWDAVNGRKLASPAADWIYDVAFSPDGKTIAIAGVEVHQMKKDRQNVISFFDPSTYQMQAQKLNGQPAVLSKLRYSPDGTMLASVDAHGNLRIWNVTTGEVVKDIRETVPGPVQLQFLANGRTLILGGGDGTLRFYEVQ